LEQEAQGVEMAVENVLAQGYRTRDIVGSETQTSIGTQQMGDLVVTAL
jgi:isocitrate/isopropylmalate dehydrogenase